MKKIRELILENSEKKVYLKSKNSHLWELINEEIIF